MNVTELMSRLRRVGLWASLCCALALGLTPAALATEGEGWHWDYGPIPNVNRPNDVCAPDASHAWVVGDGGFIVATGDGGVTWREQDSGTVMDLNAVSFPDVLHGWIVGDGTNILATTDGGITWEVLAADNATGFDEVQFVDTLHGWGLLTSLGLFPARMDGGAISFTTDGGATWTTTELPHVFPRAMDFTDATHGWAVGRRYDPGTATYPDCILSTTDGGLTWSLYDTGQYVDLTAVDFCDATHGLAAGSDGNTVLATDDGGLTWQEQPTGATGPWLAVSFPDPSHGWVAGYGGEILATDDAGATWSRQWWPSPYEEAGGVFTDVVLADASHGWALHSGEVLHTTDGGVPPAPTITSFSPASGAPGESVTLRGDYRFGVSAVTFNGVTARHALKSLTKVVATVPRGATTGRIAVTTPSGTAISATDFVVLIKPSITLRVTGLTDGVLDLGGRFTAKATVKPLGLAGNAVRLTLQRYRLGTWRTVAGVTRTTSAAGTCSWTYRPDARGSYRIRATMARTQTSAAAVTSWKRFSVR